MATLLGVLGYKITADTKDFSMAMDRAGRNLGKLGSQMKATGRTMSTYITAPIALIAGASIKMATDFEASMMKVHTLVGIAAEQVDKWRDSIKAMGPALGKTPQELSEALFVVTSAGVRGAESLKIVEAAAKASAIGLGETRVIARAVTGAMQAYGPANLSAARATDILVATVREGNLEAADLAGSLGRVMGIAAQAGVSFEQLGAFVATFTRIGVSAEEAVTALRGTLSLVLKPTKMSREALATVGMTIDDLRASIQERGLAQALVDLVGAFAGNEEMLAQVIPNVRALAGVLGTAASQGETFVQISESINNSLGMTDEGFEAVQSTAAQTFAELKAQLAATSIEIGETLLPYVVDLAEGIRDNAKAFAELDPDIQKAIIGFGLLAAAIGPVLILMGNIITNAPIVARALAGMYAKMGMLGPIGLAGASIGAGVSLAKRMQETGAVETIAPSMFAPGGIPDLAAIQQRAAREAALPVTESAAGMFEEDRAMRRFVETTKAQARQIQAVADAAGGTGGATDGLTAMEQAVMLADSRLQALTLTMQTELATMRGVADETDILTRRNELLGTVAEGVRDKIAVLQSALDQQIAMTGATSMEAQELNLELLNTQLQEAELGAEIRATTEALLAQQEQMEKTAETAESRYVGALQRALAAMQGGLPIGMGMAREWAGSMLSREQLTAAWQQVQRDYHAATPEWQRAWFERRYGVAPPGLANGGLVTSPTPAMVGEAGPELVVPLAKLGDMGGTTNVTVNINNPQVSNDMDLERIGRAVEDRIMTALRRSRRYDITR